MIPLEIHTNKASFGQLSDNMDSLIIELSLVGFSFCELNTEQYKPLFICHYPFDPLVPSLPGEQLVNAIKHFQFSKKKYKTVYINYFTQQFTLCPTPFYETDSLRAMVEFNVGSISDKLLITDDINSDIKLIYAIDEQVKSSLDVLFPHHQLKHTLTVLSKLMLQAEELLKDDILLSVNNGYIELVYKQDQKLVLVNQFAVKTQEDVLYYILFILEQYHLNPLTVSVCLVGNLDSVSPLITSLKKYIKHIRMAISHKTINWQGISGMPQHFNYTLLNRLFCE